MKAHTIRALAILAFTVAVACVPALAQQGERMTMTVPFAFSVGDTKLPAGTYRVWRTSAATGSYLIRNVEGDGSATVSSPARLEGRGETRAKLVFSAYDGEHFLTQIWMPLTSSGTELRASERELALARAGARPHLVALVATPR